MRQKSRLEVAERFDPSKATQKECEFMAPIISGEQRSLSIPKALDFADILNPNRQHDGMKSQSA